jgi:hypothetical protein
MASLLKEKRLREVMATIRLEEVQLGRLLPATHFVVAVAPANKTAAKIVFVE